ncbi:MAG TPA: hypothetical protein VIT23_05660 [Terrimicrobiaceae bacterium]
MKIHLRQIPQGGTLHVEGSQETGFLELEEVDARPCSPLHYDLEIGLSGGGLFATGRLWVCVRLRCVACLEEFERELAVEVFSVQKELDGRELVDLTSEIREDIHLALPAHPRCDAGGQKICPARFAQASADASQPSGNAPWSALDRLKTKNLENE